MLLFWKSNISVGIYDPLWFTLKQLLFIWLLFFSFEPSVEILSANVPSVALLLSAPLF